MNRLANVSSTLRVLRSANSLLLRNTTSQYQALVAPTSAITNVKIVDNKYNSQHRLLHSSALRLTAQETKQEAERVVGKPEKYEFLAETKQLLNIVAKSLYSDKEVFVRELISNASDAIEKLKYAQLSDPSAQASQIPFEIQITANDINNTLIIQDTGLGMTKEEVVKNLGTIAHSGSKAFLENLTKDKNANANNIIGQFGVGFYSAFMVADKVQVYTQSYKAGEKGVEWSSTGDGSYEISEAEGVQRGTKIVLHLKDDCTEFSKDETIRSIVNKYSNFVGYPIVVNGDKINVIQPIWLEDAKNITEDQHEEFYKFLGNYDKPRYKMIYKTDAPINIRALFYIPTSKPSVMDISQEGEVGVSLYSKKVLILSKANQIVPRWLRFLKGVVDSEDIPLNLSRELLQNSNLIRKLRTILTQRILKFLNEQSKEDEKKYLEFYHDYSMYFKEGIYRTSDQNEKEEIASLLRFESNKTEPGQLVTLNDYVQRMKPDQKEIYFYAAPSRDLALNSPYFEAVKQKDYEVLFFFEPYDEMVAMQLNQFKKKTLISIEQDTISEKNKDDVIIEGDSRSLTNTEAQELKDWLKTALSKKIKNVKITNKLDTHPCVVTADNISYLRHIIKTSYLQKDKISDFYGLVNLNLEINPKNGLIKALYSIHKKDPELAQEVAEQLMDNSLVVAGLVEDPRLVISNLNKLLEKAFTRKTV